MNDLKLPFYVRLSLSLLTVVLLFTILRVAAGVVIPLLFALLAAIMLLPLNNFFENKLRLGRSISPLLCVTLAIAVMGVFLYFLSTQLAIFLEDIPAIQIRLTGLFDTIQLWLSSKMKMSAGQQTAYIGKMLERVMDALGSSASNLLLYVSGILLFLVFVFLFTFFLLYYRRLLMRFLLALFGERNGEQVQEVVMGTKNMINAYIVGLVLEMVLVGVFSCALLLLLDIRYPFLLGIMVAIFNVIPYVGFYSAMVITMLVTFANANVNSALQAGGALIVLHLIDANVLFPRIMSKRMRVNPFVTILAVIAGQYLWGVPGMFLAVPVAGTVNLICERVGKFKVWSILLGTDE